jgi:hypothetical protein
MVNALPSFLLSHCVHLHIVAPTLLRYVCEREQVLHDMMERHGITRSVAKTTVLLTLNFGDYHKAFDAEVHWYRYSDPAELAKAQALAQQPDPILDALRAECTRIYHVLRGEEENTALHAMCKEAGGNVVGRFMAHVYFKHEAQVLHCIQGVLTARGFTVGTLIFDGLLVEKTAGDEAALLRVLHECEQTVRDRLGFAIALDEKPLTATPEDQKRLKGDFNLDDMEPFERLVHLLTLVARRDGLRRMEDRVMQPHDHIAVVYVAYVPDDLAPDHNPKAHDVPQNLALDFINRTLLNDPVYHRNVYTKKLQEWFMTQDHPHFPMIRPKDVCREAMAFLDGLYNIAEHSWHPKNLLNQPAIENNPENNPDNNPDNNPLDVNQSEGHAATQPNGVHDVAQSENYSTRPDYNPSSAVTFHYFNVKYEEVVDKPTPLWERLVKTQLYDRAFAFGDPETASEISKYNIFQALVGRLFLSAGTTDNWQVCLFLKGEANTGKGTVVDIIKALFPPESVSSFDGGRQPTFNLEDSVTKRLLLFPDVPKDLNQVLKQDVFLSMVSAESVSVARKFHTALNVRWTVPLLMAGNVIPSYDDEGGRVVRRLALFAFDTLVKDRDTTLKQKIVDQELPSIALQCLAAYHVLRARVGSDDLRKHLPDSVLASEEQIRTETSPLYDFLKNGDSFYDVVHDGASVTTILELKAAFQNHVKFHRQDQAKWSNDQHPIKTAGFTISRPNVCKVCGQVPNSQTCGEHWASGKNKKRVMVVEGMRLQKKRRDEDSLGFIL